MKHTLPLAALAAAVASLSFADEAAPAAEAVAPAPGTIRMITEATFPPYEFRQGKEVVGIDVEICKAVAKELGKTLAVMPRPEYETWFQEGLLLPGVHYVEIRPDYADLPEKLAWYDAHPEEAERILAAAHAWVDRFRDPARERLVSLRVLDRYFRATDRQ